ncbi:NAD(P)H-dependent flavin oxidoreductase [Falsiroseomonas sp. HW251]|uniref:NAD(P)H-dependent flavin oxidoreductase n=1 Tax=Falsiroseomonas sp. HW251 TaxID=3390998 RepID=UPI003D31463A
MALDPALRRSLVLPAVCAPMFLASTPKLVVESCKAGILGGLPRGIFRDFEGFEAALDAMRAELDAHRAEHPDAVIGPVAVNLPTALDEADTQRHLDACRRAGVKLIISATGNPVELIRRVKDFGARIFCDAINLRFAEKAIGAGADGIVAIGAGGGGHSGVVSHLTLVPSIREMFDGTIVMAGAVTTGAAIRAAEVLGADLAYLGTRFIATQESGVPQGYKDLLVSQRATDLIYTPALGGVDCMWLRESLRQNGLDPDDLPQPSGRMRYDHLPEGVRPWKTVWSAGQGIELIRDIPTVAELVQRLRQEYVAACETPSMVDAARG